MATSVGHEVLAARELRYRLRRELALEEHQMVAEVSLCVPGWPKAAPEFAAVFKRAIALLSQRIDTEPRACFEDSAGYYALFVTSLAPDYLKAVGCEIEGSADWGRLVDIDCHGRSGKITREQIHLPPRRCFLCGRGHMECIAERAHSLEELREAALRMAATVADSF